MFTFRLEKNCLFLKEKNLSVLSFEVEIMFSNSTTNEEKKRFFSSRSYEVGGTQLNSINKLNLKKIKNKKIFIFAAIWSSLIKNENKNNNTFAPYLALFLNIFFKKILFFLNTKITLKFLFLFRFFPNMVFNDKTES